MLIPLKVCPDFLLCTVRVYEIGENLFFRLAAREISALLPIFQANNIRLVGVGLEPLGVEEFIEGKFFKGGQSSNTHQF